MCRNKIEYMFQVKTNISKESEMTSQDCKQNMHASENSSLHQLLSEFLDQSPKKDKIFIKNELKIRPLLEVNKHNFKDECSPLAIVDFKLLQAAFKHFCETSDCVSTKDYLQPFSKASNRWKDSYFLSSKDLNAARASEESDLEKDLTELQMSEISNNISDPEVLDFCNKELSGKSLSDSLYSTVPEEYSISLLDLTPKQNVPNDVPFVHHLGVVDECITAESNPQEICENEIIPENLNVSLMKQVNQKSKAVKRKKAVFGKRKKCKKKNSLSRSNVSKSILARNVSSTDSSENCFSMSETQENKLGRDEKDLCTTEELRQNSLIAQEQQLGSTVPISPKNKAISKNDSRRSKRNVNSTESSENCLSMSETQENKLGRDEKDLCTTEELRQNSLIAQEQQLGSTVPISPKNKAISKNDSRRSKRNVSSTESSENCLSMSEIQENELGRDEEDLCTAEKIRQNSLIAQEQQLGSTVPISPKNKAIAQSDSKRSKKKLKKNLKPIIKVKITKSPRISKKDRETPQVKLFKSPNVISKVQNPSVSLQTSEGEDCDKNTNKVVKSSKTVLQAHTLFQISEQLDKNDVNSSIPPLDQSNSNIIIETGGFSEEDKHNNEKQSVLCQDSQSQKESAAFGNACSGIDSSNQEISKKSVMESLEPRYRDDLSELLDYEDDHLSDLDESESLSSPALDTVNEESDCPKKLPLREGTSDDVSNTHDVEVACREVGSNQTNSKDLLNDKPRIASPARSSRGYNMISQEMLGREGGRKRPMVSSDDSDSTSDSELSFKRRSNISPPQYQYRNVHTEQVPPSSSSKLDLVPEQYFANLNSVLQYIRNKCANHEITEAVHTANKYLDISSDTLDRLKIFKEIFHGIKKSVCLTNDISEEPLKETLDKLKAFVDNPEVRYLSKRLCSNIIQEYFQHSLLIEFALHLCTFCQTKGISINQRAIEEYARDVMSRNTPTPVLLKFLDYVKHVCKLSFPKLLFLHVLERVMRGKECYLLPDFSLLCDLLCALEPHELENAPLQKLMDVCVKNDCWDQIARLFTAWAAKKYFPEFLLRALRSRLDEAGMLFKKLAAAVYGNGEQETQCTIFFQVTGVILMLDTYHQGLTVEGKNIYVLSAIDVLHTLHKYSINFFDLERSWCNAELMGKLSADSSCRMFSAVYVVFDAIQICLLMERPKTALQIITSYAEKLREVPEIVSKSIKLEIRLKHFNLFLEVTRLLHLSDPLDTSAFRELISTLEQAGTFLDDLKECTDVNFKVIENVFNDLLIAYMNKSLIAIVFELYQYTSGRCETLLPIKPIVLRGLVVTFAKYQKNVDAHSLFTLGCHRNVYSFEKPQPDNLPWSVTILSNWTSYEMRFIIERFLQKLFPFLAKKKVKTKFEDWFTVKIAFKEIPCIPSKINCLIEPLPNALARACNILRCIHPDFTWTEYEDYILLSPNQVYCYWYKNYSQLQGKAFSVIQSHPLAFGLDADTANVNSSPTATQEDYDCNHSSPTKNHLPGEVSSTTSDHGHSLNSTNSFNDPDMAAKRRISFSSSDRSSSRTPESRLSTGESRLPQPELKSPFPVGRTSSIYEPHPGSAAVAHFHNEGPTNKRRRTDSSDMSELSNFVCSKISPKRNPPSFPQSPILNHQSPRKTFPLQSLGMTSPYKHSIGKFQSPKRQDCKSVSPIRVSAMQNKSGIFQSPKQHGSENISPMSDTLANDFIKEYRNMATKSSLLISPPISNFRNASPWVSDKSERPLNYGNLNVSSPEENVNLIIKRHNSIIKRHNSELSRVTKPSQSKTKNIVKKVRKAGTNKAQNPHKVDSENTATVKEINPTTSNNAVIPTQQKTSTAVSELMCVSSSLTNHKPTLSVFTVPPSSKVTAKRRFQMSKDADHPKLPPYRIPTPCKQLKVVRPVTPIVRSSSLRCKTPLSFQCVPNALQHIKRPMPTMHTTSNEKRGLLHRAVNAPKGKMKFENFTVSFQKNLANRVIITSPVVSRNSAVASKIKQDFSENSATTKSSTIEKPSTSDIPVSVTNVNSGFAKPMVKHTKIVQASCSTNVPENDFEKIIKFLKSKVLLKCRGIKEEELVKRATTLANTFVENNAVQRLDSKIMKQLVEFSKSIH